MKGMRQVASGFRDRLMTGVEPSSSGTERRRRRICAAASHSATQGRFFCVRWRTYERAPMESGPEKCTEPATTADANLCLRSAPRMGINVRAQIENWFVLSLAGWVPLRRARTAVCLAFLITHISCPNGRVCVYLCAAMRDALGASVRKSKL